MEERLHIHVRGEWFEVNERGEFLVGSSAHFSPNWLFLGTCTHHWHNRIIHTFADIWANPELAKKGIIWDLDHGTTRRWGNSRIVHAYKTKERTECS